MPNHPLFLPIHEQRQAAPLRDQIQIALAIAEPTVLKSLLMNCVPAIMPSHLVGAIHAEVGVPTQYQQAADGILHYEAIKCVLADATPGTTTRDGGGVGQGSRRSVDPRGSKPPRWESPSHALEVRLTVAQAMAMLGNLGFSPRQVEDILYMPAEAGHKSWWHTLDAAGDLTVPFLRILRTVRYADGTFTFQYKDYFDQEQPVCFKSQQQKVLIEIKPETENFSETLRRVNLYRSTLGITQTILVCNTISEMEAQGFISQGISIYSAMDLVLPTRANCLLCARHDCVMNGREDSPVVMCYGFLMDAEQV
ncbi:hypothetical protein BST81_10205 [Leptolyngbya sp. 'hensonii']|uniref:hypothetical protein n=1 Tax=Leptolyngbya sp. 'hensonii' TaxID=1922337 RepID=UPI00094F921B|nr:hypothetical protein [Leptolyngbya sp. 'hensonii']OLP18459.1 hypothetical protein BST81_10205 [Leptolyngbya sp. 'hensonii']